MSNTKRIVLQILIILIVFTGARLLLTACYYSSHFSQLTGFQWLSAFAYGSVFDLSAALTFAGLPLLLSVLPLQICLLPAWQRTCGWVYFILLTAMIFFLLGDIIYFKTVNRHVFDELTLVGNDLWMFWDAITSSYGIIVMIFMATILALGLAWQRFLNLTFVHPPRPTLLFIFFLLFLVLAIRGSITMKPLNIIDAYISDDSNHGQLILNGVFTAWHATLASEKSNYQTLSPEVLHSSLAQLEIDTLKPWPFVKSVPPLNMHGQEKKLNVVIILLESWATYYIDSFAGKNFKATPFFDALAKKSIKFSRYYANGTRSIEAIQSILTGFPALKGIPTLGVGFELLNVARLGKLADDLGYQTYFMQSSPRRSFRLDAAAKALGFKNYFGMEDFPQKQNYTDELKPTFGYDFELLDFAAQKFTATKTPFFGFLFTGTTHTPFILPPQALNAKDHGRDSEIGFLNTLYYSDSSLAHFFAKAEQQPWFKDTVFLLTADHTFTAYGKFSFLESHQVPLLIYAPALLAPSSQQQVASHLDILPTAAAILGTQKPLATIGRNLLAPDNSKPWVFISGRFGNAALITNDAYLRHTYRKRLEAVSLEGDRCATECFKTMENQLLGINQILHTTIKANQWQN